MGQEYYQKQRRSTAIDLSLFTFLCLVPSITKHGLKIRRGVSEYSGFVQEMKINEKKFKEVLVG